MNIMCVTRCRDGPAIYAILFLKCRPSDRVLLAMMTPAERYGSIVPSLGTDSINWTVSWIDYNPRLHPPTNTTPLQFEPIEIPLIPHHGNSARFGSLLRYWLRTDHAFLRLFAELAFHTGSIIVRRRSAGMLSM